jgi:CDP-diacylglycerol--serine O-phosphatidyltransferase
MDFLDGFAARALKAYSEIGKQLDSLCDLVTFGVLPALILNRAMLSLTWSDSIVCYTPLLIAVFAALRLAKFNTDSEQSEQFKGLATPAAALICGALGYYVVVEPYGFLAEWSRSLYFIPCLSAVLCGLMISNVPMFSFKFKKGQSGVLLFKRIAVLGFAVLSIAACLVSGLSISLAVIVTVLTYIILALF